jgi:hypothetical protein
MLKNNNFTSKIFMVKGGKKIKIKFYFIFVNFLRGGHGKCPKINFNFNFVLFLRGELEKQVIIKVWHYNCKLLIYSYFKPCPGLNLPCANVGAIKPFCLFSLFCHFFQ